MLMDLNPGKRILVLILSCHHSFCSYPFGISTKPNRANSLRGNTLFFYAFTAAFFFMNVQPAGNLFHSFGCACLAWPFTSAFDPSFDQMASG